MISDAEFKALEDRAAALEAHITDAEAIIQRLMVTRDKAIVRALDAERALAAAGIHPPGTK